VHNDFAVGHKSQGAGPDDDTAQRECDIHLCMDAGFQNAGLMWDVMLESREAGAQKEHKSAKTPSCPYQRTFLKSTAMPA
jgi:hypothetical protein